MKKGSRHSAETREKLRLAATGRRHTLEERRKQSLAQTGRPRKPFSAAHRENISRAHKGMRPWNYITDWAAKGYSAKHRWVRKHFEDPGVCWECGISDLRADLVWASIGHTYTQNRADWRRLCQPCHRRMDAAEKTTLRRNTCASQ